MSKGVGKFGIKKTARIDQGCFMVNERRVMIHLPYASGSPGAGHRTMSWIFNNYRYLRCRRLRIKVGTSIHRY